MEQPEEEFPDLKKPPSDLAKVPLNKLKREELADGYDDHLKAILMSFDSDGANKKMQKFHNDANRIFKNKLDT